MQAVKLQPYFLLALLVGAFTLAFFILKPFLAPLALAAVFATVFHPLYVWILKKTGGKRTSLSSLATVLVVAACILIPLTFLGSRLIVEADQLYTSLQSGAGSSFVASALSYADSTLMHYVPGSESASATLSANIEGYAKSALTWFIGYLASFFSGLAGLFLKLFIFFMALYYFLRDGAALKRKIIRLSPLADDDDRAIFASLKQAVHSVVTGKLAIVVIQGILASVGFVIFGVPNVILWGSVTALVALIPGVGTALVIGPAVLFLLITGHMVAGIGLLIWGVFAVGLIDNMLGPKLMGHGSGLHPLLVLLSVLGGLVFFGPVGIFLGPLAVSLLLALVAIYTNTSGVSEAA